MIHNFLIEFLKENKWLTFDVFPIAIVKRLRIIKIKIDFFPFLFILFFNFNYFKLLRDFLRNVLETKTKGKRTSFEPFNESNCFTTE